LISATAAIAVTLTVLLFGGREVKTVARELSPLPSSTVRWSTLGDPIHLPPGRYRARIVVERRDDQIEPASPASEIAGVAFAPIGSGETGHASSFRPFDFARQRTRVVHFTLRVRSESQWQWLWNEPGESSGVRVVETRVTKEAPLGMSSLGRILRDGARGTVLPVVIAFGSLLVALLFPTGRAEQPRSAAQGVRLTLLGLLAYGAAGLGLSCLLLTSSAGHAAGADEGWRWLPPLEPIAPLRATPLAAAGIGAMLVFVASVRRWAILVWTLPAAALGLHYVGRLVVPISDFQIYYNAGLALWAGTDPYAVRPERVLNPPPFVLACGLLPVLHAPMAGFVWFGLKAAAAVWCVPMARLGLTACDRASESLALRAGTRGWRRSRWVRPEFLALLAGGRLIGMDLQFGNTNTLVLLALLSTAAAWAHGRTGGAAAALAGGVALKATPLVAIVGVGMSGRWRWAASALLISLAVVALSAVALDLRAPGAGWGFLREASPRPGDLSMGRVDNQSLRGMTDRMVGGAEVSTKTLRSVPSLRWGARAARQTEAALGLGVLALVWVLARRAGRTPAAAPDGWRAWASLWAGVTLAMLLLSPGSWTVHFALLYLPLVVLAERALAGDRVAGAAFAIVAIVVNLPPMARPLSDLFAAWSSLTLASLVALAALVGVGGEGSTRTRMSGRKG
jgi:hypothetical protein